MFLKIARSQKATPWHAPTLAKGTRNWLADARPSPIRNGSAHMRPATAPARAACQSLSHLLRMNHSASGRPKSNDAPTVNVPMMMAFWGFVFVAVCEVVRWRLRRGIQPVAKTAEAQPDDVEKLLNELLLQAESKRAMEQRSEDRGQKAEERKPE